MGKLCVGRNRDGRQCRSVAVDGQFCDHHARLAADVGDAAVREGAYLQPKKRLRVVAETPMPKRSRALAHGRSTTVIAEPATVRQELAAAAAENVEELKEMLLDAVGAATS